MSAGDLAEKAGPVVGQDQGDRRRPVGKAGTGRGDKAKETAGGLFDKAKDLLGEQEG